MTKAVNRLEKRQKILDQVQEHSGSGCLSGYCPAIITRPWTRLVTRPWARWRTRVAAKKYDKASRKLAEYKKSMGQTMDDITLPIKGPSKPLQSELLDKGEFGAMLKV